MITMLDALRSVRTTLEDRSRWMKGADARTKNHMQCDPRSPDARCWCINGALARATGTTRWPFEIGRVLGFATAREIVAFNDARTTKHRDVIARIDAAIAKLSAT